MDQQGFSSHCSNDMFMAAMEKQFYAEAALWIPLLRHGADMDHQKIARVNIILRIKQKWSKVTHI